MTYTLPEIPARWFHVAKEIIDRDRHQVSIQGPYVVARARSGDQWLRLLCGMPPLSKGFTTIEDRDAALEILTGRRPLPELPVETAAP